MPKVLDLSRHADDGFDRRRVTFPNGSSFRLSDYEDLSYRESQSVQKRLQALSDPDEANDLGSQLLAGTAILKLLFYDDVPKRLLDDLSSREQWAIIQAFTAPPTQVEETAAETAT